MKLLIIGGGSIGQRHLRNLRELGVEEIGVVEIADKRREEIKEKYRVATYKDLKPALKEKWDGFFICVPPALHIKTLLAVINKKTPVFIEKPLSNDLKKLQALGDKIKKFKIPVMVGYNLSFHPQLQEIKRILNRNVLGKIWGVKAEFGQYLPDWRPQEDYRHGYSAQKKLGGGIILDDIHEIDYLFYLFGKVKKVFCFAGKISNLEIDTEDYAEIIFQCQNGIIGEIQMDYLQRTASRQLKIIGEKGTLLWDLKENELRYWLSGSKKWRGKKLKNFDFNQTYLEEIKHFFDCIRRKEKPEPDFKRGIETLKIALAAKKSAQWQKVLYL